MGRRLRTGRRISGLVATALLGVAAMLGGGAFAQTDLPSSPETGGEAEATAGSPSRDAGDPGRVQEVPGGDLPGDDDPGGAPPGDESPPPDRGPGGGLGGGGTGGGGTGDDEGTGTEQVPGVDLEVTKTDSPDPVAAGANLVYTVTVINHGEDEAPNVMVFDDPPDDAPVLEATSSQGSCSVGGGGPSCNLGTISGGGSATATFTALVLPDTPAGTVLTNEAGATTTASEGTTSNNFDTEMTIVTTVADVAVTKSDAPDPVPTGTNLTYSIGAANLGPSDAQNATVTDTIPAGTTFVSFTAPAGWTSTTPPVGGTGTVTATKPTFAWNESAFFTLVVNVTVPSGNLIDNTVTISTTTTDPDPANNTDMSQASVAGSANLSVTKTDSPDPVTAGSNLTYTITATNGGGDFANNVTLTDTLPSGTTFVSLMSPAGWTCTTPAVGSTGTVSCGNSSVAPAASAAFTLVVNVNAGVAGGTTISNTASVSSSTFDPNTGNNSATATTTVNTSADLSVTKTDSPDPVIAGSTLAYAIAATNNGPSSAASASLTDVVPTGTTFVSFTAPAGWATTTPAVGGTGTVTATNPSFAPGATATFTLVVNVNSNVPTGGTITNTASVSSATSDPNSGNNSDTETTGVNTSADLSVTKTDSPDPVIAGNNVTYGITVANAGPSDAQNVTVSDALPAGTSFFSATPSQGSCSSAAGTVTCTLGTIAAGGSATITIVVTVNSSVPDGTVLSNTATAASATSDPNGTNNSDTETTAVTTSADLSVTKSDSPDPVIAGNILTYTITATNNGPSNSGGDVTVTDPLPAGTTLDSATPSQGSCTGTTTITCDLGPLASGGSATITVVVHVDPGVENGATLTNTATGSAPADDPNSENNSDTETTTVATSADLEVSKSDDPDPVTAGTDLTYTVTVTNNGPSHAQDVDLTDTLPGGTAFVSATPSQGSCPGTGPVACALGDIDAGASVTITIVVHIDPSVPDETELANTATVHSETSDPNSENDSVTETTEVATSADLALTKEAAPDPVTAGNDLTYKITATNNGPSDAQDVTVTDELPPGTSLVSATPSQGSCSGAGTVTCDLGTLANGATATITLVVHVGAATAAGAIANSATVDSETSDPNSRNDAASARVAVLAAPVADRASTVGPPVAVALVAVPRFTG